jgi:hypothetical protein
MHANRAGYSIAPILPRIARGGRLLRIARADSIRQSRTFAFTLA